MSPRSTNRFNSREVARALKAARLAGERPERVEIDPQSGKITVIIAQASDATTATQPVGTRFCPMLKTRSGLPRHCTYQPDRDGSRRVRFRRRAVSRYLTGIPWSEDFMRQYAAALDGVAAQASNIGEARTIP